MYFKEITSKENDEFSSMYPKGHIFQSSRWANVKEQWKAVYLGGYYRNEEQVLSCVLLTRKIPATHKSMGYIPRGPVCDFMDKALLCGFTEFLKVYCRENHVAFITMDPDIPLAVNGVSDKNGEKIAETLKNCGFKERRALNFEQIQANHVFRVKWEQNGVSKDEIRQKIFQRFEEKTRYNIRVAQRRCLSVEIYDKNDVTEDKIDTFYSLMRQTNKRDNFVPRSKKYFRNLLDTLYPYSKLFLIKYDPEKDLRNAEDETKNLREQLEKYHEAAKKYAAEPSCAKQQNAVEIKIREICRQIESVNERCSRIKPFLNCRDIYLSGSIYGFFCGKSWYLYGASADYCRDTMPNYLMQWAMIQYGIDAGCSMYDLRGVPGIQEPSNPLIGLYKFDRL